MLLKMNNRLKFRAWCKLDFETPDGPLLFEQKLDKYNFPIFVCKNDPEIQYELSIPFGDPDWIIQQSLGKQDRDGKEIYEGDIVEYVEGVELGDKQKCIGVVKYDDYLCAYGMSHSKEDDCIDFIMDGTVSNIKIIGNIIENKEILNK